MPVLSRLSAWWKSRQAKPLSERLQVEFDEVEVRVRAVDGLDSDWNQAFRWADITRVCFRDGGLWASDCILVVLSDRERAAVVLTEAKGGSEFFGALCDRGLFPLKVRRTATGDTSGGTHCWPPYEK